MIYYLLLLVVLLNTNVKPQSTSCYLDACEQRCEIIHDVPTCTCLEGFERVNEYNCQLKRDFCHGSLLFTDSVTNNSNKSGEAILEWPLFNSSGEANGDDVKPTIRIPPFPHRHIKKLEWDSKTNDIYFLSKRSYQNSLDVIFTSRNPFLSIIHLYGHLIVTFTYDWVADNVYYVIDGEGIGVCSRTACAPALIRTRMKVTIDAILLHPKRGVLIWAVWHWTNLKSFIMHAGMDGSKTNVLCGGIDQRINQLFMDYAREVIYFISNGSVWFVELSRHFNGEEIVELQPQELFVGQRRMNNVSTLLVFNNFFFFVDINNSQLMRLPQFVESNRTVEPDILTQLKSQNSILTITNRAYYEVLPDNICNATKCSDICLLKPSSSLWPTSICMCGPDSVITSAGDCIAKKKIKQLLGYKARVSPSNISNALREHRELREGNSLSILWALILACVPSMVVNLATCLALIHVIVTDYMQYLRVINQ